MTEFITSPWQCFVFDWLMLLWCLYNCSFTVKTVTAIIRRSEFHKISRIIKYAQFWTKNAFLRKGCILYTWTCLFPVDSNEKSHSILYTSAYCTGDFAVDGNSCGIVSLNLPFSNTFQWGELAVLSTTWLCFLFVKFLLTKSWIKILFRCSVDVEINLILKFNDATWWML